MRAVTAPAPPSARRRRSAGRRILRGLGWAFLTAGVLVVLFIVYQLFVTNLITDRIQEGLRRDLVRELDRAEGAGGGSAPRSIPGEGVAILRIPAIALDAAVVEGVDPAHLKRGPGHYPRTPMPGEGGNVGIAGHRTTYGKPFWALDQLVPGDEIFLRTREGRFVYRVTERRVVAPDRSEVLEPTPRPTLTLTTCHPRFSAAQRLIVHGELVRAPAGVEVAA